MKMITYRNILLKLVVEAEINVNAEAANDAMEKQFSRKGLNFSASNAISALKFSHGRSVQA